MNGETVVTHKYVTTKWETQGWAGREDCVCCGFAMIGANRALIVSKHAAKRGVPVCDGCVNAIAERADGKVVYASGEVLA